MKSKQRTIQKPYHSTTVASQQKHAFGYSSPACPPNVPQTNTGWDTTVKQTGSSSPYSRMASRPGTGVHGGSGPSDPSTGCPREPRGLLGIYLTEIGARLLSLLKTYSRQSPSLKPVTARSLYSEPLPGIAMCCWPMKAGKSWAGLIQTPQVEKQTTYYVDYAGFTTDRSAVWRVDEIQSTTQCNKLGASSDD